MKIIEIITEPGRIDTILGIAEQNKIIDVWYFKSGDDQRNVVRMLVKIEQVQMILDQLQKTLTASSESRVVVLPVDVSLPRQENEEEVKEGKKTSKSSASREELYHQVNKSAQLDRNYLLLVILSTIVAAVGMIENNLAVVIGAMVIAPLLSPNIALALGTVLGDNPLMTRAITTLLAGIVIALVVSVLLTFIYPLKPFSDALMDRTDVGLSSVAMALASGAAAALSMTTGLSTVLVGVMVAVAILPPTAALGLMLGYQSLQLAYGAFMLLAINIVCINLAATSVFLMKGINPRTHTEKRKAKTNMAIYMIMWLSLLFILVFTLYTLPNKGLIEPFGQ